MIKISARDVIYYHGTSLKRSADGIMSEGLRPLSRSELAEKYYDRSDVIPMKGGVYLTKDIFEAFMYCFWYQGDDWEDFIKKEPFGYIFIFDGEAIRDYIPDEDEVGRMVNSFLMEHITPQLQWLYDMAKVELEKNPRLKKQVQEGYIGGLASIGKLLIPKMNKEQIDQICELGSNIVSKTKLKPSAMYKIKKPETRLRAYDNQAYGEYMKQPGILERVDFE
jgi:hypothetical protein